MESQETGFPPFSLLLEIPTGFPNFHRFDGGIDILKPIRDGGSKGRLRSTEQCMSRYSQMFDLFGNCLPAMVPARAFVVLGRKGLKNRGK